MSEEQLKIVGVGLPRTGTTSLQLALIHLGYNCYHMREVLFKNDSKKWLNIIDGYQCNFNENIFKPRGYNAGVDYPVCYWYKSILKENPNAKVRLHIISFNIL